MNSWVNKGYFIIKYVVPVLIVAGIIFYLSAQPNLGSWMSNPLENILRKGAHFAEYGLLAFFLWRLFYSGWKFFLGTSFAISLFLVTLYASSDEFHQFFVDGRNGSIIDVVVDFFSAFIILQFMILLVKRKLRQSITKNVILMIIGILSFTGVVSIVIWQAYEGSKIMNENIDVKIYNNNDISTILKNKEEKSQKSEKENEKNKENLVKSIKKEENINNNLTQQKDKLLPKKVKHKVPFMVQSPFAKWDELHEEACEEASLIMLKYYNNILVEEANFLAEENGLSKVFPKIGRVNLSKKIAEEEIQKIIKYQIEKYDDFHDTDIQTTKEIGEEYFSLSNLKIIENFEIIDLKKELAQGNIILIPTAGRELKNPYFSGLGPLYHNLVIIGYNDTKNIFVTNDPGTRRGESYKYNQQVLYNAIHDFIGDKNKILEGEKRAVVLIGN